MESLLTRKNLAETLTGTLRTQQLHRMFGFVANECSETNFVSARPPFNTGPLWEFHKPRA